MRALAAEAGRGRSVQFRAWARLRWTLNRSRTPQTAILPDREGLGARKGCAQLCLLKQKRRGEPHPRGGRGWGWRSSIQARIRISSLGEASLRRGFSGADR
jgi:hypothetical protein